MGGVGVGVLRKQSGVVRLRSQRQLMPAKEESEAQPPSATPHLPHVLATATPRHKPVAIKKHVCFKSWLHSMDTILFTMMKRIATLREKHKDKEGIVHGVKGLLHDRWERVLGYEVFQLTATSDEFTIVRKRTGASESFTQYTINVALRVCECGEWQEYGFPCVDVLAYLRLHRGLPHRRPGIKI